MIRKQVDCLPVDISVLKLVVCYLSVLEAMLDTIQSKTEV